MLNTVSRITKKVMMAQLEASNSGWPMGTAEPHQGIMWLALALTWILFDQYGGTFERYFHCSGFEERNMRRIYFVEQLIMSQKRNNPNSASISIC